MCTFVTATLPDQRAVDLVAARGDLPARLLPISNIGIERQLLPSEIYCAVEGLERGDCYCGTVLGAGRDADWLDEREARARFKKAARLRKKGWSEAKTNAWLEQQEQAAGRRDERSVDVGPSEHKQWLRLADLVLRQTKIDHLGLLVHFYRHDVRTESFDLSFEEVDLDDLDEARLRQFEENVLYRIRP